MNEYWEASAPEIEEEEFPESGRPGCLSVFAVMLAAGGIGYGIVFAIMGLNLIVDGSGRTALGALITLGAIPLALVSAVVAVGLWRLRVWAWWLIVILGALGLGLGALSFVAALLGADPMRALGFVLGPLMGLMVGAVVLVWFLRNREHFGQEEVEGATGRPEEGQAKQVEANNGPAIFAVTVMGCMTLFCVAAVAVVFLIFALGGMPLLSEIMRSLRLPAG